MLYSLYEAHHLAIAPWRYWAELARGWFGHPFSPFTHLPLSRRVAASSDVFLRITERYEKPAWNIPEAQPEVVQAKPFCHLTHFKKQTPGGPKVLLVAPLSGHHATLLRDTVRSLMMAPERSRERTTSPLSAFTNTSSGTTLGCPAFDTVGKSITDGVMSGAVTMKMTSSTSITSTYGTMLISCIGPRRRTDGIYFTA